MLLCAGRIGHLVISAEFIGDGDPGSGSTIVGAGRGSSDVSIELQSG